MSLGTGRLTDLLPTSGAVNRRLFELSVAVAVHTLFVGLYLAFLNPNYEYYGFRRSLSLNSVLLTYPLVIGSYYMLPGRESGIDSVALRLLFGLLLLPTFGLYAVTTQSTTFLLSVVLAFALACAVVRVRTRNYVVVLEDILLGRRITSRRLAVGTVLVLSAVTYTGIVAANGLPSLVAVDLSDVYDVRGQFRYAFPGFTYLVVWQAKVLNPFLIGLGWHHCRPSVVGVGLVFQSVLYLYTGHKLFLFGLGIVFLALYTVRSGQFLTALLRGVAAAAVATVLIFTVTGRIHLAYLVIGRLYFLTADIQYHYVEFFSKSPFVYLTDSKIAFFLSDRYDRAIPEVIGQMYYDPETYANGSIFGDAFSHFGYLGVVSFGGALGVVLKTFEWTTERTPTALVLATSLVPLYSLTQTGLTTVVLTHGLAPAAVLLLLYRGTVATDSVDVSQTGPRDET